MARTVSCPIPVNVIDRKVGSSEHYRTVMAVSATVLDREITDADWMAKITAIWDNAPTKSVVEDELDRIRQEMLTYFRLKNDKATSEQLWNTWIRSTCWGLPGYMREDAPVKTKGRKVGDLNLICPSHECQHVKDAKAERKKPVESCVLRKRLMPA